LHHHRLTRAPDRDTSFAVTRGGALRTAALAAGGALATVTAIGAADRLSAAPSPEQDVRVLNLLLLVERVEVAFYEAALERSGLSGELEEYARAVVAHEREPLAYLEDALGDKPDPEPEYDLEVVTADPDAFARGGQAGGHRGRRVQRPGDQRHSRRVPRRRPDRLRGGAACCVDPQHPQRRSRAGRPRHAVRRGEGPA
jgi:Ferritin-like domain